MSEAHNQGSESGITQRLTERQVCEELGLDQVELYLIATAEKVGRHDPVSHLMVFSDEEVDALAARLGVPRRKRAEPQRADVNLPQLPEPSSE